MIVAESVCVPCSFESELVEERLADISSDRDDDLDGVLSCVSEFVEDFEFEISFDRDDVGEVELRVRVRSKLYDFVMDSAALDVVVSSTVAVVDFDGVGSPVSDSDDDCVDVSDNVMLFCELGVDDLSSVKVPPVLVIVSETEVEGVRDSEIDTLGETVMD